LHEELACKGFETDTSVGNGEIKVKHSSFVVEELEESIHLRYLRTSNVSLTFPKSIIDL